MGRLIVLMALLMAAGCQTLGGNTRCRPGTASCCKPVAAPAPAPPAEVKPKLPQAAARTIEEPTQGAEVITVSVVPHPGNLAIAAPPRSDDQEKLRPRSDDVEKLRPRPDDVEKLRLLIEELNNRMIRMERNLRDAQPKAAPVSIAPPVSAAPPVATIPQPVATARPVPAAPVPTATVENSPPRSPISSAPPERSDWRLRTCEPIQGNTFIRQVSTSPLEDAKKAP